MLKKLTSFYRRFLPLLGLYVIVFSFSAPVRAISPGTPTPTPTATASATPVPAGTSCKMVLTTVITNGHFDCNNVPFESYISSLLDTLIPWIFVVATVMIVYSGVQYMLASVGGGDVKAAKQRIIGSLIGVAFYFLIRLILNQISNGIVL